MERSYGDAITALNTLQTNATVINAIRQSGRGMNRQAIPEMIEWCRRIGYEPSDFNRLNAIHIAGTKGKGSTSAFISSILAQYIPFRSSNSTSQSSSLDASPNSSIPITKIGLYTSPHLRFVRERVQLNNAPLSEPAFAVSFFETWDRFEASALSAGDSRNPCAKPVYFRFLTLMAFHTYMREGVDTAVIECGIGGEYDSTNILERPTVTGITNLGIDHTAVLGETIEEIAWHKAGIMKTGAVCYTVEQPQGAMRVLKERAKEKGVRLHVVRDPHPMIESGAVKLGLAGEFQKTNASLAIQVAAEHLRTLGHSTIDVSLKLPAEFVRGLSQAQWGGRCETRVEGPLAWHLDGGHTQESITAAGDWFASCVLTSASSDLSAIAGHAAAHANNSDLPRTLPSPAVVPRILIFNQQKRAGIPLLETLYKLMSRELNTACPFTHAIFSTNVTFSDTGYRPDLVAMNTAMDVLDKLEVQRESETGWKRISNDMGETLVARTIEEAVGAARGIVKQWAGDGEAGKGDIEDGTIKVLVTGSVHLVGGVLEVLETEGSEKKLMQGGRPIDGGREA